MFIKIVYCTTLLELKHLWYGESPSQWCRQNVPAILAWVIYTCFSFLVRKLVHFKKSSHTTVHGYLLPVCIPGPYFYSLNLTILTFFSSTSRVHYRFVCWSENLVSALVDRVLRGAAIAANLEVQWTVSPGQVIKTSSHWWGCSGSGLKIT